MLEELISMLTQEHLDVVWKAVRQRQQGLDRERRERGRGRPKDEATPKKMEQWIKVAWWRCVEKRSWRNIAEKVGMPWGNETEARSSENRLRQQTYKAADAFFDKLEYWEMLNPDAFTEDFAKTFVCDLVIASFGWDVIRADPDVPSKERINLLGQDFAAKMVLLWTKHNDNIAKEKTLRARRVIAQAKLGISTQKRAD